MNFALITPPAEEPITLGEGKLYCRVTGSAEDTLVTAMIRAARIGCENLARMSFLTQTRRQEMRAPTGRLSTRPADADDPDEILNGVRLVNGPAASIASIYGVHGDGTLQTIATEHVELDIPTSIIRWKPTFWEALNGAPTIRVTYQAGRTKEEFALHHPDIIDCILMLTEHKYTNRGVAGTVIPQAVKTALMPYWSSTTYVP